MDEIKSFQIRELRNIDQWAEQIAYWRTHLDVFIEEYFKIKLKDVQKIQARAFGNCDTLQFVQSRGFGKTWITAVCCQAMGVLYPDTPIVVASGTAGQANQVLKKIDGYFIKNENILREIECDGHAPVQITLNGGLCTLKNGSTIESMPTSRMRGARAKIVVIDEAPEVKKEDQDAVIRPLRNYTRPSCIQIGIKDYSSKMVSITSACLKSSYFYSIFVDTLREMARGDQTVFACALDYHAAIRAGISPAEFFEKERKNMPETKFQMEYGSIFVGAEMGSLFPYDLTEPCRVLRDVEVAMPMKSNSEYVMGVDLATSGAKSADNAVITILKLVELESGEYIKKLVFIRSYHGKRQDYLATEVRKLYVKFPNIIKIVFDHRGLGDAFPQFMSQPWIDSDTKKEYPPLVCDNEKSTIHGAIPLLRPCVADSTVNQQIVTTLTISLERGSLELPIASRLIIGNTIRFDNDDDNGSHKQSQQEKAIFIETDALQIEMGNVVSKSTPSGSVIYDVAKTTQHKDRYSSIGMAIRYISELEEARKKRIGQQRNNACIGLVIKM